MPFSYTIVLVGYDTYAGVMLYLQDNYVMHTMVMRFAMVCYVTMLWSCTMSWKTSYAHIMHEAFVRFALVDHDTDTMAVHFLDITASCLMSSYTLCTFAISCMLWPCLKRMLYICCVLVDIDTLWSRTMS